MEAPLLSYMVSSMLRTRQGCIHLKVIVKAEPWLRDEPYTMCIDVTYRVPQ